MPNLSLKKLWRKKSVTISEKDPSYKVIYLGNVLTGWAKGEGCVDKALSTLWRNYCQSSRNDILMKVTICGSGLNAVTREHGLTEYWAHRVTFCCAPPAYPKVFCWVYRHEGRRLKQELRCHAVLCHRNDKAQVMAQQLKERLVLALHEFRREKVVRQNARLSLVHAIYDSAALPTRKVLLSTGASNYRPPLERSKSAPKLGSIEETIEEEEEPQSPIAEEESEEETQAEETVKRDVKSSPVGSIALSETLSDIVHYNNRTEIPFIIPRSSNDHPTEIPFIIPIPSNDQSSYQRQESPLLTSNSRDNTSNITSITNSYSSPSLINISNNGNNSLNNNSHVKTPTIKRKFVRSITIDESFDDGDEFSEETCLINSKDIRLLDITSLSNTLIADNSKISLIAPSNSSRNSLIAPNSSNSLLVEDLKRSSETVEDAPHTPEDSISLMRGLSLTRQLSLPQRDSPNPPEESLTSDQPESLGSHSCSSSCGGCSDAGAEAPHPDVAEERMGAVMCLEGEGEDNISEESGYGEEKDFMQQNEMQRVLSA